jgi:Tfp pilus assembly protein PilN
MKIMPKTCLKFDRAQGTINRQVYRMPMALLLASALSACGVEAVGSAATGAAIKKQELEQGQAQKEAIQQQLQQALDQGQQRQQALEQATK